MKSYPMLTPYQFAANSPIFFIDTDGREIVPSSSLNSYYKSLFNKSIKTLRSNTMFGKVYDQVHGSAQIFEVDMYNLRDKRDIEYIRKGHTFGFFRRAYDIVNDFFFFETVSRAGSRENSHQIKFRPGGRNHVGEKFSSTSTVFEEVFHAGQYLFYDDRQSSLSTETEAKVARAYVFFLNGGIKGVPGYGEKEGPKQFEGWGENAVGEGYYFNQLDGVSEYFTALKEGSEISSALESRFRNSVKEFSKAIAPAYEVENEVDSYDGSTEYFDSLNR